MYDVIVIGAGFAGITAARELSRAGAKVLILEGRNRIGGRTHRVAYEGQHFELGGVSVHWLQPHVTAEMTRYGFGFVNDDGAQIEEFHVLSGGTLHRLPAFDAYEMLDAAYRTLYSAAPSGVSLYPNPYAPLESRDWMHHADLSVADTLTGLDVSPLQRDALSAMLSTDLSAPPETVALIEVLRRHALLGSDDFEKVVDANGTYTIQGGTSALLRAMLDDGDSELRTGEAVVSVRRQNDALVVRGTSEEYRARRAVVAAPLNTWNTIDFDPPLRAQKQRLSSERHGGAGYKCFIRVTGSSPVPLALAPPPHDCSFLSPYRVINDGAWLIAFGPAGPPRFDVDWAHALVRDLIPDARVSDVVGASWTSDPFSRGTWASFRPGQAQALEELILPEERIHFAGADIALGWRGYIDGAIESGLRVARQIVSA